MDIEDILNGPEPEAEAVAVAPATPETPEPEITTDPASPPRDEHGRFAPKGEPETPAIEAAPPAVETTQAPPGLIEERRKRQEAEQRYEQLLQRFQQPATPAPQPTPQPLIPSVYEDEDGFAQGLMGLAVQQAQQALLPQVQQLMQQQQVDFQERLAAAKYPDYEEKCSAFVEMTKANPALVHELRQQRDPAEFAYRYATNALQVQQLGSLDVESIKAAAVAEYLAKQPAQITPPPPIPTSLADAQSSRNSAATPQAPPSLNEILGR